MKQEKTISLRHYYWTIAFLGWTVFYALTKIKSFDFIIFQSSTDITRCAIGAALLVGLADIGGRFLDWLQSFIERRGNKQSSTE